MSSAGFKALIAIGLAGIALTAKADRKFSPLIASETVQQYRQAVDEARQGHAPIAMAMLEGLLLNRPVRVSILSKGMPSRCGIEYSDGVAHGIQAWSRVLPDSPFRLAKPGEPADITVHFVSRIRRGGDTQGIVNLRRHYSWTGDWHKYQLFGEIQIRDVAFGRRLTGDEVERVLAHELGHVLGLGDDYDGPGIMSAFREDGGAMLPSRDEAEAVSKFRSHLRAVLRRTPNE